IITGLGFLRTLMIIEDFLFCFRTWCRFFFCDTWSTGANWTTRMSQLLDQFKINFAFFQIDSCNLDLDFITQTEDLTAVLADQTLAALIKDKEVIAQLAHMHHTIDIEVFQCDKQTKF